MDLRRRIVEFAGAASLEVTSHDRESRQQLIGLLAAGSTVYVAHTPNSTIGDVAEAACEVEGDGFRACPHVVARRVPDQRALTDALARMQRRGVTRALLVAGDQQPPAGAFASSLDVLATGALEAHGFTSLGFAGHPEGNPRIDEAALWSSLADKQRHGERTGAKLHIVSQFSFDAEAIVAWLRRLDNEGITLPVHVGIMGPATIGTLIRYARLCGIGESLRALTSRMGEPSLLRGLAASAEEMLVHIVRAREEGLAARIVQPHFFAFGGVVKTARWLQAIRDGDFELDAAGNTLTVRR